jgi:hypothetical protein
VGETALRPKALLRDEMWATVPLGNEEEVRLTHPFRRLEQDQTDEAQGDALVGKLMAEERQQTEHRRSCAWRGCQGIRRGCRSGAGRVEERMAALPASSVSAGGDGDAF